MEHRGVRRSHGHAGSTSSTSAAVSRPTRAVLAQPTGGGPNGDRVNGERVGPRPGVTPGPYSRRGVHRARRRVIELASAHAERPMSLTASDIPAALYRRV